MAQPTATEAARPDRGPAVTLQRHCSTRGPVRPQDECADCRDGRLSLEAASGLAPGALARQDLRGGLPAGQRRATDHARAADGAVPDVALDVATRSGRPLDAATQAQLTAHFGHSFARVHVHDDTDAATAASAVGALAYTVGNAMVFGRGQYQPSTTAGRRLIAHEAAHVVQQRSGQVAAVSTPTVGAADSPLERQADRAAEAVVAGHRPSGGSAQASAADGQGPVRAGQPAVQRQPDTEAEDAPAEEEPSDAVKVIDSRPEDELPLLAFRGAPVLQRKDGAASCPPYNGYSPTVSLRSYNCAGLAHRSYDFKSVEETEALLGAGTPVACNASCATDTVKHWLWQYDLDGELDGKRIKGGRDFHTVAGPAGTGGADPANVFSKNGKRRVYGPATGPSFRPATRERDLTNDPSETPKSVGGFPVYKLRSNYVERCACRACPSQTPPTQGPSAE